MVSTPPVDSDDMDMATEPRNVLLFKEWFVSHGGSFHPGVRYSKSSSGFSIVARETIEPDATIVTCPFSMIITPVLAKDALLPILQLQAMMERWTERQSIIVYVCFHWIASPEISYDTLIHTPYLNTLPSPSQLRTTLHFTQAELDALRGTNLYGATLDRRQVWETEWEECRADISAVNAEWGKEFTWERFLTASTYLSSRAFPSTLLSSSSSPSLDQHQPDPCPVLIPGIDALNHAHAQPVSWVVPSSPVSASASAPAAISLVTHDASNPGSEIFNNYGPKPNSELLLGYGFTLPANPDDTILLKIGGARDTTTAAAAAAAAAAHARYEVGREAHGAAAVWGAIMDAVKAENEEDHEEEEGSEAPEWQTILDSADMLRSMTESLLGRLPSPPQARTVPEYEADTITLRGDVVQMIGHYVSGQREVLQDLLQYADDREMGGVAVARQEGIVIQLEGGDEDVSE